MERRMPGRMPAARSRPVASVLAHLCIGCGVCESECRPRAIRVADVATVDPAICTGCGRCVDACPVQAIVVAAPLRRRA